MRAEISYDLDMDDDMSFVEGTYRLPDRQWEVFIFGPDASASRPEVSFGRWESGVTGVFVRWPPGMRLNKSAVLAILSEALGVAEWGEARGPDSIQLR